MENSQKVWSTFSVTKDSGTKKFKILDLPSDRIEECADLIIEYFAKEEPTYVAAGVSESEEALTEYKNVVVELLSAGLYSAVICCVDNGDDGIGDIAGSSVMLISTKEDSLEKKPKTKEIRKLIEMTEIMESKYEVMKKFNLEKYYDDRGIVVHPDYRGNGIAQEFLKVRGLICKEHGVPMTGAWMTSYGTQIAAKREGWETVYELSKGEVAKEAGVSLEKVPTTSPAVSLLMINKV